LAKLLSAELPQGTEPVFHAESRGKTVMQTCCCFDSKMNHSFPNLADFPPRQQKQCPKARHIDRRSRQDPRCRLATTSAVRASTPPAPTTMPSCFCTCAAFLLLEVRMRRAVKADATRLLYVVLV